MHTLLAFFALAALLALGNTLAPWLPLPVPGPLVGLLLLLAALIAIGRVPQALHKASQPLLRHMMLLFIPAVAGIVVYIEPLQGQWLPFLLACLIGTALTLVVTVAVFQWALNRFGES